MKNKTSLLAALVLVVLVTVAASYYVFFYNGRSDGRAEWQSRDAKIAKLDTNLKSLGKEIQTLQGKGDCKYDSQCRVVGLGAPVCGFSKDFLVYSTDDTDEPSLLMLIAEFNRIHQEFITLTLTANSCGTKPAPVHCLNHRCTAEIRRAD